MKSVEWKTYRTRFLVKARQLRSSLSFVDALGRQHCGRKGDYLVESSDGVVSIAPRQIFEDIYVPMTEEQSTCVRATGIVGARKLPQSDRDRRGLGFHIGLMGSLPRAKGTKALACCGDADSLRCCRQAMPDGVLRDTRLHQP